MLDGGGLLEGATLLPLPRTERGPVRFDGGPMTGPVIDIERCGWSIVGSLSSAAGGRDGGTLRFDGGPLTDEDGPSSEVTTFSSSRAGRFVNGSMNLLRSWGLPIHASLRPGSMRSPPKCTMGCRPENACSFARWVLRPPRSRHGNWPLHPPGTQTDKPVGRDCRVG
jgi:hypothetical protein